MNKGSGLGNGRGDRRGAGANSDNHRTLVYVEGDASMRKYESREGKTESALSIVQRAYPLTFLPTPQFTAH